MTNPYGRYRFHWLDGKVQDGDGHGPADALARLGFGAGALGVLDYWELVEARNPAVIYAEEIPLFHASIDD